MPASTHVLRRATFDDLPRLEALIALSIRRLGANDYSAAQIEGALRGAFGVDTQLIRDGTYFVVDQNEQLIACGGWSRRKTLFGAMPAPTAILRNSIPRSTLRRCARFSCIPSSRGAASVRPFSIAASTKLWSMASVDSS